MLSKLSALLLPLGLLAACGEPPPIQTTMDDKGLTLVTEKFMVPPGDVFECFYTSYTTDRELSVPSAVGWQGPGGHHITVYYTTNPRAPGHHPCSEEEMVEWHQVAGAGDENQQSGAEGAIALPKGLATRIPAGVQIVAQAHYINTTGKSYEVQDKVQLKLEDPATLKAYANQFVLVDGTFQVPAGLVRQRTSTCVVPADTQVVLMLGHMHELGQHYKLERVDDKGQVLETLLDVPWQPVYASHPPLKAFTAEAPRLFTKGTRLRQTCAWENTTKEMVSFPREMCVTFMYYFPDRGELQCALSDITTDGK